MNCWCVVKKEDFRNANHSWWIRDLVLPGWPETSLWETTPGIGQHPATALAPPLGCKTSKPSNCSPTASLSRSTIEKHALPRIVVSDDGPKILAARLKDKCNAASITAPRICWVVFMMQ